MQRYYYANSIKAFLLSGNDSVYHELLKKDEFRATDQQKNAWQKEIEILSVQLLSIPDGDIVFEYTVPRIGHRIDVVCLINGIIFLLEFKTEAKDYAQSTDEQVMDYALDLKYFHEESNNRYIVPINVSAEALDEEQTISFMHDNIATVLRCNKNNIGETINEVCKLVSGSELSLNGWVDSRYYPTPTIIEAAQAMYRNHTVKDIKWKEADKQNLGATTDAIGAIIDDCKRNHKKAICFVTGVPGAGKTLAGLNIANSRHKFDSEEHAVFLSGNGPLVDVLQEALARDRAKRDGITKKNAKRETKAFIQIIHKFRDDALTSNLPPIERVAIFDEAQRAWDKKNLSDFMKRKKGIVNFQQSEPEFLISILDRHPDWATIVCLVGGGQEIYTGEAGIEDWFSAIREHYPNWTVYLSERMNDSEYIGSSSIDELLRGCNYYYESSLHLGVPLRSFRSEKLAAFIKALLDNHPDESFRLYQDLCINYKVYVTRDYEKAKEWVKQKSRGSERYGVIASSEGKRLRGEGIWVLSEINHIAWFLDKKEHIDSSNHLEVAASEFKVQGLEVDYALLAWDADLRRKNGEFDYYRFRGTSWNHINIAQRQKYLINAYRVLLTRARQGLVIYVPRGVDKAEDETRDSTVYDEIYEYLRSCGIMELSDIIDTEV